LEVYAPEKVFTAHPQESGKKEKLLISTIRSAERRLSYLKPYVKAT
jgi:hypothetical protein